MSKKITSVSQAHELMWAFSNKHQVPVGDMVLGGGVALMLHGMREDTNDVNVWIEEEHFFRLAVEKKVICHPMTDTAFMIEVNGVEFWIRKANPYHESDDDLYMFRTYNILALIVQKRGGILRVERPLVKRQQDRIDLVKLDEVFKEKNKVRT